MSQVAGLIAIPFVAGACVVGYFIGTSRRDDAWRARMADIYQAMPNDGSATVDALHALASGRQTPA